MLVIPDELAYVSVALRCGLDPEVVRDWDVRTYEDVTLLLRVQDAHAQSQARAVSRGN